MLATLEFTTIIALLNLLYCFAAMLEFAAFLKLRIARPDLERPYRVPLSTGGCVVLLAPPTLLLALVMCLADARVWLTCVGFGMVGAALYPILRAAKHRGWCE